MYLQMKRKFTEKELKELVVNPLTKRGTRYPRGWSRDQFKEAFAQKGMSFRNFEMQLGLSASVVSQSLDRRMPKVDKLISKFLGVPLCELWPNQYFVNDLPIPGAFNPCFLRDEELKLLNDEILKPKRICYMNFNEPKFYVYLGKDGKPVSLPPGITDQSTKRS